jgi:16S rRNA (cytosine967-C5)-methyltransferase
VRRPFDSFLRRYFYEHRDLGGSERAVISQGAFDLLRHHSLLSFLTRDSKAEWESRVRVLESDDAIQKALADKTIPMYTPYLLLKTPKAHQGKLPAVVSTQVAHCHSLFDLLAKRHGNDKAFGFMLASNEKPPLTIRVNALKATREEFLRSSELQCRRTEISPVGLQLVTRH